ncbi:hypothetical protein ABEG17_17630 [Pedococcus sp. KACC 23699]|uniref:Uncharacterized protein n=1 Tax=Pedococcus sp. KACC 23699 TaxID=3149228 RepID=A0AAU7JSX8_9MICO
MPYTRQVRPFDVAVGLSGLLLGRAFSTTRRAGRALEPVAGTVLHSRWTSWALQDRWRLEMLSLQGQAQRAALLDEVARRLDALVPLVLTEVLRRADLTDLVLRYVDLDQVVAAVDVDAVAAQLDVQAVLDQLDLTAVVLEKVDLGTVVQAALDRVDLIALAGEVIEGVDLPEIIRESTGTMASDTVQGVRMHSIAADEVVGRAVDRLLLRRGHKADHASSPPGAPSPSPATPRAPNDPHR